MKKVDDRTVQGSAENELEPLATQMVPRCVILPRSGEAQFIITEEAPLYVSRPDGSVVRIFFMLGKLYAAESEGAITLSEGDNDFPEGNLQIEVLAKNDTFAQVKIHERSGSEQLIAMIGQVAERVRTHIGMDVSIDEGDLSGAISFKDFIWGATEAEEILLTLRDHRFRDRRDKPRHVIGRIVQENGMLYFENSNSGMRVPLLDNQTTFIGRRYQDCGKTLEQRSFFAGARRIVSANHLKITVIKVLQGRMIRVKDLNATNGTYFYVLRRPRIRMDAVGDISAINAFSYDEKFSDVALCGGAVGSMISSDGSLTGILRAPKKLLENKCGILCDPISRTVVVVEPYDADPLSAHSVGFVLACIYESIKRGVFPDNLWDAVCRQWASRYSHQFGNLPKVIFAAAREIFKDGQKVLQVHCVGDCSASLIAIDEIGTPINPPKWDAAYMSPGGVSGGIRAFETLVEFERPVMVVLHSGDAALAPSDIGAIVARCQREKRLENVAFEVAAEAWQGRRTQDCGVAVAQMICGV